MEHDRCCKCKGRVHPAQQHCRLLCHAVLYVLQASCNALHACGGIAARCYPLYAAAHIVGIPVCFVCTCNSLHPHFLQSAEYGLSTGSANQAAARLTVLPVRMAIWHACNHVEDAHECLTAGILVTQPQYDFECFHFALHSCSRKQGLGQLYHGMHSFVLPGQRHLLH